jgi:hypothetical protein
VRAANQYERRVKASEHLKRIHHLITEVVETAHRDVSQSFGPQMRLRAELSIAYAAPLPKCLELVDRSLATTMTIQELDTLAPAALEEVEAAHQTVWEGSGMDTYVYRAGDRAGDQSPPI